ncbi:MAG: UDP-N-acetylglucosamine 4-epimerase [Alphaproteobacteria bacterium MarineAlpha5_Bin11]|nr:NAD-dependent dehydratase [Pelagibacteraceae bacterium]PPR42450.1 MAG: UDP-N-acetylglucosamine 4-epimerase [Alphaproteobacteria bacterium MarineAlpha5_Bin11]PPR51872.1 MAG: UDP-N-acetylglucosamine 4-epimerase [Alphaproteobacteria bacterium MarineAlpha5_Bin10]|tara:strand:+ start:2100 stop:3032 length:933 start_codon:yes stop_codon:yes gene_type:complete
MKKILVTGGCGFLGSHLCEKLLKRKSFVFCVDNLFTGDKDNISHIIGNKNFRFIKKDINKGINLQVDEIFNLACPASPIHYQYDPVETIKTNVQGTINILNLAKKCGSKVFQASTSEVYGDPVLHPQKENYWGNVNPIGLRSCYDEGKRCAETLFFDYFRQHKIKIKVARIFNTFGPRMHVNDGRVVSNFVVQALKNEDITIYGKGNQTRSFCYVDDMIEGIINFFYSSNKITGPMNLGNIQECSMKNLAEEIIFLTQSKSKIIFKKLPSDDPKKRKPDISYALKTIKWEPKTSLREGLLKTISYFKKAI